MNNQSLTLLALECSVMQTVFPIATITHVL